MPISVTKSGGMKDKLVLNTAEGTLESGRKGLAAQFNFKWERMSSFL